MAAFPSQALAQSGGAFQGSDTVVAGSASRNITGPNTETITIGSPTATINWAPYDTTGTGTINFLPSGHTATFTNNPQSTADFTVLNRIIPTDPSRPIALNGHVISQLQDTSGNVSRGGNVWFYSPGGIMIGSTAVFDVGGLLLSVNDAISWSTNSTGFTGHFARNDSNAQVNIASGAQINALANNSYVAVVAPRVEQHGSIRVDGAAALAAGQDVTLTMNQGLFDIQVDVGTDDPNGIVHTGSTGGPASGGVGDNHGIFVTAVPKNQAMTMLLQGNWGFDAATTASVENGAIYISAGVTNLAVFETNPVGRRIQSLRPGTPVASSVQFRPTLVTSAVEGQATTNFELSTAGSTTATLLGEAAFYGGARAEVIANPGGTIELRENLTLYSFANGTPGLARIAAFDTGRVTVVGATELYAGIPFSKSYPSEYDIRSGHALVEAAGGTVSLGSLDMTAFESRGGDNFGGTAQLLANAGGQVSILGDALLRTTVGAGSGATSHGGHSELSADNGDIAIGGDLTLLASGSNSNGGSSAVGGTAAVQIGGGGGSINVAGQARLSAVGRAGSGDTGTGQAGGTGTGGTATVSVQAPSAGATADASFGSLILNVGATGGAGDMSSATWGNGGSASAGSARVVVGGGSLTVAGAMTVDANASGGNGHIGGNGTGGLAHIYAQDAILNFASATVSTNGTGGSGNVGGRGSGGSAPAGDPFATTAGAFVSVRNGSVVGTDLTVSSTGTGGAGSAGAGGHGVGGLASVTALNGTATGLIEANNVTVDASAVGGAGGAGADGGIGQGGQAYLLARAVNGSLVVDAATIRATGTGGTGSAGVSGGAGGAGGAGYGGWTNFGTSSGQMTSTEREGIATFGTVDADVSGTGGAGGAGDGSGAGGAGGVGIGGSGTMLARGSRVNATSVGITANGTGGLGGLDGAATARAAAGIGIGGSAGLLATNIFQGTDPSTVVVGSLTATASGIAADASAATQAGGVLIQVVNSSAQIGTLAMTAAGAGPPNFTGTDAFGNSFTLGPQQSGIIADNATVHLTGNGQITSGDAITLQANPAGLLDVDGNFTLTSGSTIGILAVGDGRFNVDGTLSATTLAGADGGEDVSVTHHTSAEDDTQPAGQTTVTAGAIVLNSANDIELGGSSINVAGTAQLTYADDVELGDLRAGSSIRVRLASALVPEAEGHSALITGLVAAPNISIESGALHIGETGQLGEAGFTDSLELIARSFGTPVIVGGSDETGTAEGQYHLTQAEAERIEADSVTFLATSATQQSPQVVVRDLTIEGSAGGGTSSVRLITPGSVRVEGDLAYINAAASDALTISAGERLEVITPDGSIRMVDGAGALAGMLTLQSENIVVTDAALAQRLADDPEFAGRNEALATNNGPVNMAGYLQAAGIRLLTARNIFIQNTGTATEFAGLTVGGQGLLVGRYQASTNPDGTQTFSFTGTLTTANDVLYFDFTISSESQITLRTYSYAGGTNGAGEEIPGGGFDPILALFNAAGELIAQNDDGGSNVPADPNTGAHYDTFLQQLLPAGTYTVAVTAFSNFAIGPNLSNGFENDGNFNGRSPHFAFDVIGADAVTRPDDTPLTVVAFGRMQNADGSFTTGNAFFDTVNFSAVQYTQGSTFNGCPAGGSCTAPPPPPQPEPQPEPTPAPPPVAGQDVVLGPVEVIASETAAEDEADGSTTITTSTGLVDTGPGVIEDLLDEAVTSGGDAAQWIDDEADEEECAPGDTRPQCKEGTN